MMQREGARGRGSDVSLGTLALVERFAWSAVCAAGLVVGGSTARAEGEGKSAAPASEAPARRAMEEGKRAYRERRFEDAAASFANAYRDDPSLVIALYNQAFALGKTARLAEARDVYLRYLELVPGDLDAVFAVAGVELKLGESASAKGHFEEYVAREQRPPKAKQVASAREQLALLSSPQAPATVADASGVGDGVDVGEAQRWLTTAKSAYAEKRFADAAEAYHQAFARDPSLTQALYRAALSSRKAAQLEQAQGYYQQYLALVPGDPDGTYGLAETCRLLGDVEKALGLFERYIVVEQRPSEARYVARAKQWVDELRPQLPASTAVAEEAPAGAPMASRAVSGEPATSPVTTQSAGQAPSMELAGDDAVEGPGRPPAGQSSKPLTDLAKEQALQQLEERGAAALARGEAQQALDAFRLVVAQADAVSSPTAQAAQLGMVRALWLLGRYEDAEDALQTIERWVAEPNLVVEPWLREEFERLTAWNDAQQGTGPSPAFVARAETLREQAESAWQERDRVRAIELAEQALQYEPESVDTWVALGDWSVVSEDFPRAERAYRRALVLAPESARPVWGLAQLSRMQRNDDDARRYYRLYIRMDAVDKSEGQVREAKMFVELPKM